MPPASPKPRAGGRPARRAGGTAFEPRGHFGAPPSDHDGRHIGKAAPQSISLPRTGLVRSREAAMSEDRQPSLFIPHGGGPCFFMDDPRGTWTGMANFLRGLPAMLPNRPKAIIVVSGHWETEGFAFTGAARPPLVYDYYGFPPHTYEIRYDAPGAPDLARRAADLLRAAGIAGQVDEER